VLGLPNGRSYWSAQQYRNLGLEGGRDSPPDSLEYMAERVDPQEREQALAAIRACVQDGTPFDADWRVAWPDGSQHIVKVQGRRNNDAQGKPRLFVCVTLDMTERRRIEANLLQSRMDLTRAQDFAQIGTWAVDFEKGVAETSSEETRRVFGFEEAAVPLAALNARIHPDDLPAVEAARARFLANPGTGYRIQYRTVPRQGEVRYVEVQAESQVSAGGKVVRIGGFLRDITDAKLAEQEIERLAYYDEVTGLPNRVSLRRKLEAAMAVGCDTFSPIALMVVAPARFRDICLTLGHSNGDILLKDIALRIGAVLGKDAFVARTGSSQFSAVLTGDQAYESTAVARAVNKAFEEPFPVAGLQYDINLHIGIALFPGHAEEPGGLMRKADVALYRAREMAHDVLVYNPEEDPYNPQRLALLGEFRRAVNEGQIQLYCQPKVDLRSGTVMGAESLVRWRHPRMGLIPPDQFVPLIEDTELIQVLTRHMLQASVRQCYAWQREGIQVPLAVNLSTRNLLSRELVPNLENLLHTWGGTPDWLGLEITESSLINDPNASIAELNTLSRMGFRLFIDDFGTGYSSLSYLMRMPVNVIKVDHGFTMHMVRDKGAAAIVKSTIELAHNLGMTVVAEGTADKAIWDALLELGCDEAQGFYVSEPLPAAQFVSWARATGYALQGSPGRPH
jgi:diguanylate cyclase (GGDEF)-like protein/PAS domain S-box-containing protein